MIVEGNLVDVNGKRTGQVKIGNGGMVAVGKNLGIADYSFDDNCLIFPGFVDIHVHLRYGEEHKEDFITGSRAAINGGIVAVVDQPNNPIGFAPIDKETYERKKQKAQEALIDIFLYAGIGPATEPFDAPFYKVFMGPSVGDLFFENDESLENQLTKYNGKVISFHCEDPAVLDMFKHTATHEYQRPKYAEILAINKAVDFIRKYNLKGNICHVSTKEGLDLIQEGVTCEVTPHHLFFDEENKKRFNRGNLVKMNPPVRTEQDRFYLLDSLKNGRITYLATDHAPHTLEEKVDKNPSGVPMLDTYGPFVAWLILQQGITPERITEVCSYNPGLFVGEKYGLIESGYIGSLTVLNMVRPVTITPEMLKTKCGWSPFEGFTFPGSVEATVVNGNIYFNSDF